MAQDLGQFVAQILRASDPVKALVVGGVDGILETGDLDGRALEKAQEARRAEAAPGDKVLNILVWDTGETARGGNLTLRTVTCSVFVYDRGADYSRIRVVREAVIEAVVNQPASLTRDAFVVEVRYAGRTGHRRFDEFNLDYERIDFAGPLSGMDEPDAYH